MLRVHLRIFHCDDQFLANEMKNPTGAVGRCGRLTRLTETILERGVVQYANNDLAGACTVLHTYGACVHANKVAFLLNTNPPATIYISHSCVVHKICNRSDKPALTLHIYAPGLRKMRIFKECGGVTVAATPIMSEQGEKTGLWTSNTDADGVIDVQAWHEFGN